MIDTPAAQAQPSHARIPAPIVWVQDHLLLGLLMVGSGVINARFLVYGLVPNINDPSTWGLIDTMEIAALALAGLALGGLEVRISYKLGECIANRQRGRAVFLAFGMLVLAFIEFWASYSQRSQNIPITAADNALLRLFNLQGSSLNVTAICIALAIPFISIFWGFAADDPTPKPIEDSATLAQRQENERLTAEHRAKMRLIAAKGNREAAGALFARPVIASVPEDEVLADPTPAQQPTPLPRPASGPKPKPIPGSKDYPAYIEQQRLILISQGQPSDDAALAEAAGETVEDVRKALRNFREQEAQNRPAGKKHR